MHRRGFLKSVALASLTSVDRSGLDLGLESGDSQPVSKTYLRISSDQKHWEIGNDLVARELCYSRQNGLHTTSWKSKVTGTEFLRTLKISSSVWGPQTPWGEEFSFQADKELYTGAVKGPSSAFALAGAVEHDIAEEGKLLEIRLRLEQKNLDLFIFYAVYAGQPVIRKWISFANRGNEPIVLSHLMIESLHLQAAPPSEQIISVFNGVHPREIFYTGGVEDAAIFQRNPRTGEGFVAMNEAPGWMKRTEMTNNLRGDWGAGIRIGYNSDVFPFRKSIKPGGTFTSAKSGVAFFKDGYGMYDPQWVMPTYTSRVLMRGGADYQPPWIYDSMGHNQKKDVMELIPIASGMGMDVFSLDWGWSRDFLSFELLESLDGVCKAIENAGMQPGLWLSLDVVSTKARIYREHPEWVMKGPDGKEKVGSEVLNFQDRTMCLDSPFRAWVAEKINALLQRYHPKHLELDLTTALNAYGRWVPGCYAEGHYHRSWAESLAGIYEGIEYVASRIRRENPDVLIDLTFELWGQKQIIDYALLGAGDLDWMSNVADANGASAGPRQARTLLYQRCLAMPVEAMLIGNLQATTPRVEEHFGTVIGSSPVMVGDLRRLTEDQVKWYAEKVRWIKELRRVAHFNESFFPLGNWIQPKVTAWDGFARVSRRGEGLIVIFRNDSLAKRAEVQMLPYPKGQFRVQSVLTGEMLGEYSSGQFERGISISFPEGMKAEILEVRKS